MVKRQKNELFLNELERQFLQRLEEYALNGVRPYFLAPKSGKIVFVDLLVVVLAQSAIFRRFEQSNFACFSLVDGKWCALSKS